MRQTAALLLCASAMVGRVLAGGDGDGDGDGALDNCNTNAWAKIPGGGSCFREDPDENFTRWGWNNQILKQDGETTLELWASANNCETDKGWDAGNVTVVVAGNKVTVTYNPSAGTALAQYQLYVGAEEWSEKNNGDPHVNPKRYPYKGTLDANHPIIVNLDECPFFYVQAHATACKVPPPGCNTNAWAKITDGGNCFRDEEENFTRWGWNNEIQNVDGETTLELWASANKCQTDKGWDAGSVKVLVAGNQVTVTYIPSAGTILPEYHLYVGASEWSEKNNGDPHVNPKRYPYAGTLDANHPIIVNLDPCPVFYVQAHALACKEVTPCPEGATPAPSRSTNPPVPFTFPPRITLPPTELKTGFTQAPTNGPACPIAMNGSVECECSEFSCDSPSSPWTDKDYRFCGQCPSYLNGAYHFSCPHCASSGTEVSFTCPNNWESCDVFVQVYSNCATGNTDGGLAYNLRSEEWTPGSCGPSFCLSFNDTCQSPPTNAVQQVGDTNIQWKMVLFHKQFAGGDEIAIPALATEPTMYFTFFVKEGHFCTNDKTDQASCEQTPSVCKWNAGTTNECFADICPPVVPPPGARPCCDVAPGVEGADCAAGNTEITSVCDFNLPQCSR